jgi:isoleucyl-tRNA synthetase
MGGRIFRSYGAEFVTGIRFYRHFAATRLSETRCWNYSTRVGESQRYPTVCERCVAALDEIETS